MLCINIYSCLSGTSGVPRKASGELKDCYLSRTLLTDAQDTLDDDYQMTDGGEEISSGESQVFEEDTLSGEEGGVVLGNPDMEDAKSLASNEEEYEDPSGNFVRQEGGLPAEEIERNVREDSQLKNIRQAQSRKFFAMVKRQVWRLFPWSYELD